MCGGSNLITKVDARSLGPEDFVREYVAENTPVILQSALSEDWAACLALTPDSLVKAAPSNTRVRVAPLMADGRDKWVESASLWPEAEAAEALPGVIHTDRVLAVAASRIEVPIEEFAASLKVGRPLFYADGASNLGQSFHFLGATVPPPPAVASRLSFLRTDLWLGGRTLSSLHFDNVENLFVQLVGEKEFVLCPPGDTVHLVEGRLRKAYATWHPPRISEGGMGHFERSSEGLSQEAVMNYPAYNVDSPPPEYAARAAKLRRSVVRLRAGEVLYLPFGWWHQVRAFPDEQGLCASAACFFEPFFVRLQPKALPHPGPLLPNPRYKDLCKELGLDDSDDEG